MIMPTSGSSVRFDLNYNPSSWSPSTPFTRMPPVELQDWLHDIKLPWTFRPPALRVFLFEKNGVPLFLFSTSEIPGLQFHSVCLFVCLLFLETNSTENAMSPGHSYHHKQRYWLPAFPSAATHPLQMYTPMWRCICFPVCFPWSFGMLICYAFFS